ncbi:SDR family oxidoreductase [Alloacidobacterium dinghuense]|uniref:SDR family oxidoreductase n=1 Tax=Alloacidobacterium dinghuense TaxID=2763107 RepID=A0A7G8BMK2_9BACT|nr:SDR family oxidoreductase [Alloacidobacterium dinghuense]QNI33772.1 SDR family oxidoreductase [Alloacidobacterium dinghuense]
MAKEKKVAFITGGNRGIGLETARQLGKGDGIKVVIGSRDLGKGQAVAKELRADGADVDVIRFDITKPADYKEAYDYFDKNYGKLDILINNAGVSKETFMAPNNTSTVTQAVLRETFDTNFFGTIELTQVLLPLIKKAPEGRIVNLSSILGSLTLHADPDSPIYGAKALAYDASKAALNAFTVHLAHELRDTKIKVNSAHPGWVKTDMGTDAAPMELPDGAKTSVQLATLASDGPTGGYFHMGEALPW